MNLKKYGIAVGAVVVAILMVVLICRGCDGGDVPTQPTIGDVDITDTRPSTNPTTPIDEMQNITFVGRAEYVVSSASPKIEVRNSEKNEDLGVNFVFTIIDVESNEIIARTPQVAPGKYAYINVMDYYKNPGSYNIIVSIRVTDNKGNELNGMDQEAILHVLAE